MFLPRVRKIAFIHIQRTGGTSIKQLLHQLKHPLQQILAGHYLYRNLPNKFDDYSNEYFAFSFVRNPWQRMVSWYLFLRNHGNHDLDFNTFVFSFSKEQIPNDYFLPSQLDFLTPAENQKPLDFIGRYESLQDDLRTVFTQMEIPLADIPQLNALADYDYRDYYTSETKRIVSQYCEKEIDLFRYTF